MKETNRKCLFCNNPLDNSDEHIIPDSINGKLHSKYIICHHCNTKKFGLKIDPIIKKIFNPIMLTLGFKNVNSIQIEDPDGKKFIHSKEGQILPIKPERIIAIKDGALIVSVEGDRKNACRLLEKTAKSLLGNKKIPVSLSIKEISYSGLPLSFSYKIEISQVLKIAINKIALEYYSYCEFEIEPIKHLTERINTLDEKIDNVIFCNWNEEIRKVPYNEISHLIVIKSDSTKKLLYAYIELFNVICAFIKLNEDYSGQAINTYYHQDVFTGKKLKYDIILNIEQEPINENNTEDFNILLNNMYERFKNIQFNKSLKKIATKAKEQLDNDLNKGLVSVAQYDMALLNKTCEAITHFTLYNYPYMIEDYKEEENDDINYFNSNMNEKAFEEFCNLYKDIIGVKVTFPDKEEFVFDSFIKRPFLERNNIALVKVYCLLINIVTGRKKYVPYRNFFEGIKINE